MLDRSHSGGEPDLETLVETLFEAEPTSDVRALKASGLSASAFFAQELQPNWDGRSRAERSAKIQSFVRLANALGGEDAGGIGAIVRTKVVLLAWGYDRAYEQQLLRQIVLTPQRFGTLPVPAGR